MHILAVDSSSEVASVSLFADGKIDTLANADKLTHSQKLLPLIDMLLSRNNIQVKDIDVFVSSMGPGSFTGIRIGIATCKALAHVGNKKIAGYTSLDMLAQNAIKEGKYICPCIDAKHANVYYGVYKTDGEKLETVIENSCDNIANVAEKCKALGEDVIFVGNGAVNNKEALADFTVLDTHSVQDSKDLLALYNANPQEVTYAEFIPVYLRESQAERNLKK